MPLLFKAREALGRPTKLDPKLKIFSFDDTTFARLGTPDLAMKVWAKILAGVAERKPRVVYIDKIFSLPPDPSPEESEALEQLESISMKSVTTAFIAGSPIKFRTAMPLEAPIYRLETYFDSPRDMVTQGFVPIAEAFTSVPYAADQRLTGVFRFAGHSMNAGFGFAQALISTAKGRVLPHMTLIGADRLKFSRRELLYDFGDATNVLVPLDRKGRMFVDYSPVAHYFASSKRMLGMVENALSGKPQTAVNEGDTVLLLPAMYTGHTDFTVTPIGPLPGPFVVASLINSVIRQTWIKPFAHNSVVTIVACFLAAFVVSQFGGFGWFATFGVLIVWLGVAAGLFVYAHLLVDTTAPAMAFLTTALISSAQRSGVREKLVLIMKLLKTENEKLQDEIDQASQIASAFRPSPPPRWSGLTIGAFHQSLSAASGDWYAFETSPSGKFRHFVMCDISGHGVQAAIVVSTCKTVLSLLARQHPESMESAEFLIRYVATLNETLFRHGRGGHVTTLAGVTFQRDSNEVRFICCGHPQPLVLRLGGARAAVERLNSFHNPVGIKSALGPDLTVTTLGPKDHLLVYTDGVRLPRSGRKLDKKLLELARETPPQEAVARLSFMDWSDGAKGLVPPPDDDISLVWFVSAPPGEELRKDKPRREAG